MAKKLKKSKLILITLIFLLFLSYVYKTDIKEITSRVVNPDKLAKENDVEQYNEALKNNDELLCLQIIFEDFKNECLVRVAEAKEDISICEKILNSKAKYSCYTGISQISNDVEICKLVEEDAYWNNVCYKNYAIANNNSDYCWFIQKGTQNNACFYEVVVKTLDWEGCKDITDESKLNKCNNMIAQKSGIIEPCYQMSNIIDRDACIIRLARASNDNKYCEEIKYSTIREDCKKIFTGE